MRRALAAAAVAAALAGCGGGDDARLKVAAASSLKNALPAYDADPSYSFAGSDELASQIRLGARPDVFAAANTALPRRLFVAGLVEKPVVFAANRLVIAVPSSTRKVRSVADLEKPGVTIAVGARYVPVGAYTRAVIARVGFARERRIERNIRSKEPDVAGIVGKVTQRAVDAGIVYVTDVRAARGRLDAIELPRRLQPSVRYAAAVVRATKRRDAARAYVDGLPGAAALREAGFGPP